MPSDQPVFVIVTRELLESLAQFLDRVEDPHPQQVLLERADEPFGDAIALWFTHEGGRGFDAQTLDFVLKVAGHVVGAVIMTQFQSTRHAGRDGSEAAMNALAHRLQRLEAIG